MFLNFRFCPIFMKKNNITFQKTVITLQKQVSHFEKQVSHFKMIGDAHFTHFVPEKKSEFEHS